MLSEQMAMPRGVESAVLPIDGTAAALNTVTLVNSSGTRVQLCDLGASLLSVHTADRYGHLDNILLTYADPQHWLDNRDYLGVTVGRVANRIGGAGFQLHDRDVVLLANDGDNHLHGGPTGLSKKRWAIVQSESGPAGQSVTFRCESADGDGGYPGNLAVEQTYRLGEDNTLTLEYRASSDSATPVALTNHCYWNLAGRDGILEHELVIHSEQLLEVDRQLVPTGRLLDVAGTPVDFRKRKKIGRDIDAWPGGYDNFWVVDATADKRLKPLAELTHPPSGRSLKIVSSEAGVQFYSGNFLDGSCRRDSGSPIQQYAGMCLEAHGFPDAPNHPHFPSIILQPGEEYQQTTIYTFSAE